MNNSLAKSDIHHKISLEFLKLTSPKPGQMARHVSTIIFNSSQANMHNILVHSCKLGWIHGKWEVLGALPEKTRCEVYRRNLGNNTAVK